METSPPPFNPGTNYPPPRKKKSPIGLILALVVGLISICCLLPLGGVAAFVSKYWKGGVSFINCQTGVSVARAALLQYERKNGKFPPAETWQDDIKPFYDSMINSSKNKGKPGGISIWKGDDNWVCSSVQPQSGIAYNVELAGKSRKDVPDSSILLFEVPTVGRNQHEKYQKRSTSTGPIIGDGNHRDWLDISIAGKSAQGAMVIDTKEDADESSASETDDESPPASPAKPTKATKPKGSAKSDD